MFYAIWALTCDSRTFAVADLTVWNSLSDNARPVSCDTWKWIYLLVVSIDGTRYIKLFYETVRYDQTETLTDLTETEQCIILIIVIVK